MNNLSNSFANPLTEYDKPLTVQMWAGKPQLSPRVVPTHPQPPPGASTLPFYHFQPGQSNVLAAPRARSGLPPGVYKTEPYSCIVVVPGPQLDDRSIVHPGGGYSAMPMITPDLRFIPYHPQTTNK